MRNVKAHSIQQYNKWKGFLNGKIPLSEMKILAQTYQSDMLSLFGWNRLMSNDEADLLKDFALIIRPPKNFNIQHNIGRCKYVVNFHDRETYHKDESPFYSIQIFKNKVKLRKFCTELINQGYQELNCIP